MVHIKCKNIYARNYLEESVEKKFGRNQKGIEAPFSFQSVREKSSA